MVAFAATGCGLLPVNTPSIGADFCRLIAFTSRHRLRPKPHEFADQALANASR
jgi:hypothetical protein